MALIDVERPDLVIAEMLPRAVEKLLVARPRPLHAAAKDFLAQHVWFGLTEKA